jgi:hypothetical protein
MSMKTFTLPPEDSDDDGEPNSIEHNTDYMVFEGNAPEFYYNFLEYKWEPDGGLVSARAYLDDIQEVSIFADDLTLEMLNEARFAPIIRYLQRRFRVIKLFGATDGYVVVYTRGKIAM